MRNNYIDILQHKVEIPIIQRDYAQGRTDAKTSKIRKDFLDVLFELIRNKHKEAPDAEIELDFIYGFNEQDDTFIPIDGQQRLTTLWLLYWFVAEKEDVPENDKIFLSNFLYETRHSTTEFCKGLIKFKPDFWGNNISEEITDQSWYFETWAYDPSIQAMLTVLDDIQSRYDLLNIDSIWATIGGSACPFYFYKLDMDKVGLTDDLYIKMNSRGKALTEFEYFKAGFSEHLKGTAEKKRFENSIDGKWIDAVWHIVMDSGSVSNEDDIAQVVDNSFLNLFNFITSVIAFKKDIKAASDARYTDTVVSADLLKVIYNDKESQNILFDTLDTVCHQTTNEPLFWNTIFYYGKYEFDPTKTRLFFQHNEVNLIKSCIFRGLTLPEQILLHACLTHLRLQSSGFEKRIRVLRNLVANSDNELRSTILGSAFTEAEDYIENGDLYVLNNFKTDQIEEEKKKEQFLTRTGKETNVLRNLEDSAILRGSISIIPLDGNFGNRAQIFLEHFDEDILKSSLESRCNLLLCFGDYSQADGELRNLIDKSDVRRFFTTGYHKPDFYSNTQIVVLKCLDYFITTPTASVTSKVTDTLAYYTTSPKDWKYYFIKYPSFRENCFRGYYEWRDAQYCIWKMGKRQFNGYHWDPFLYETVQSTTSDKLTLSNYGMHEKLTLSQNRNKILISSRANGFLFENGMTTGTVSFLMHKLINDGVISSNGELIVSQNDEGIDLEDRLEKLHQVLEDMLN